MRLGILPRNGGEETTVQHAKCQSKHTNTLKNKQKIVKYRKIGNRSYIYCKEYPNWHSPQNKKINGYLPVINDL